MTLSVDITEKSFGDKSLYTDLHFTVQDGEKVGLIGRNGSGKSTLFQMILGSDTDFQGTISSGRDAVMIASRQEHHGLDDLAVIEYIQGDLPEFIELDKIITTYPEHMGSDTKKLQRYSDALERFTDLGYFQIEDELEQAFAAYQIDGAMLHRKLGDLSGGQKRMVELIKVQRARGTLALIDEPTNHMDYVAKQAFIKWLIAAQESVVVITHDRDVLQTVDKIIEIRDGQAISYRGNYKKYLQTNASKVTAQVNDYDLTQRRIANLRLDIIRFRRLKERSRDPGTIRRFKSQEQKAVSELAQLSNLEKPSFWIDKQSAQDLNTKMTTAYEKYKATNIKLSTGTKLSGSSRLLVQATDFSLGYSDQPLFAPISFSLNESERIRLYGRNGAGKTTLVATIMAQLNSTKLESKRFSGSLAVAEDLRLGLYEQELPDHYMDKTLAQAIEEVYRDKNIPFSEQRLKQTLSNYLFEPNSDGDTSIERLSGGQKARLQLISMLVNDPDILILDEPTNHLDLPSIEELEAALKNYKGALIYISHDSYFADTLGGTTVSLAPVPV